MGNSFGTGVALVFFTVFYPLSIPPILFIYLLRISKNILDNVWVSILIPIAYFVPSFYLTLNVGVDFFCSTLTNYIVDAVFSWTQCFPLFVILLLLFLWQLVSDYRSESKVQGNMCRMTRCTYDNITENNISSANAKCNAGSRVVAYPVFIVMTGALLQFIIQVFFTSGNLQYWLFVALGYIAYCVINHLWLEGCINKRIVLFPEVILPLIALTCWLAANWRNLQAFCMITVSAAENIVRTIF